MPFKSDRGAELHGAVLDFDWSQERLRPGGLDLPVELWWRPG
jgi:hypothetical protein